MNTWFLYCMHSNQHLGPCSAEIHGLTDEQQNIAKATFRKMGPIRIDFVKDLSILRSYETVVRTWLHISRFTAFDTLSSKAETLTWMQNHT